jgi:hypothetical protein
VLLRRRLLQLLRIIIGCGSLSVDRLMLARLTLANRQAGAAKCVAFETRTIESGAGQKRSVLMSNYW